MELGLEGRVAVVTGASRGIGRQIGIDLAAEGCHVVLCGRDPSELESTAGVAEALEVRALVVAVDLVERHAAAHIAQRAVDEFGRIDILVNNAGGNVPRKLLALTADDWQAGFEQNFFSAVRLTQACLPVMQAAGWGRIINVASTFGLEPDPYFGPYSAAKAALINYSKNLAKAFSADGVLTNCIVPGVTLTEGVEANAAAAAERQSTTPDEVMAKMMEKDPPAVGRFGDPAEVAAAVVFLAGESASWITGACLAVDGGTLRGC